MQGLERDIDRLQLELDHTRNQHELNLKAKQDMFDMHALSMQAKLDFVNSSSDQTRESLKETIKQLQTQLQQMQAQVILRADNWIDTHDHDEQVAMLKVEARDDRIKLSEQV